VNSRSRIAAAAKGPILVKRLLALGRCLALGFLSSTSQGMPLVSASRMILPSRRRLIFCSFSPIANALVDRARYWLQGLFLQGYGFRPFLRKRTPGWSQRRFFIGGSDARIIMGTDEATLVRLWREKRGETEPEDLSGNLIVQLGKATEDLNRAWYERNTGRQVTAIQRRARHSAIPWMAATLDGVVEGIGAVFEAKFMLPWSFSEEAAAEKYMAQVQHNMWVTHSREAVLSIITGGGKWVEIKIPMDPLYLTVLVSAEKKFWRCVQSGEVPHLVNAEPPRPRIEAIRIVDMGSSNSWAEFAALFLNTRSAFLEHERAKNELKSLIPEDAKEAIGHGVRAKRSKSGAVSFDLLEAEASHAAVQ
jgi:putative phage-type endonuclease